MYPYAAVCIPMQLYVALCSPMQLFVLLIYREKDDDRNQAMASALGTVMKNIGVNLATKNPNTSLDRCQSFVAKDKKTFKLRPNKKVRGIMYTT